MKLIEFVGYVVLTLVLSFLLLGCTAQVQKLPTATPGGWPNPRIYHDRDWEGNKLVAVVNQVSRPIVVAIICDGHEIEDLLVPGLGVNEYYIPEGVVCFLRDWKVVAK